MSQRELLALVIGELNRLGIPYMLTGSLASSMQGVPRSTHDIDLVVALASEQIDALVAAFGEPDYYLSREAIQDALRNRSMFNLISLADGEKVDFWMLTDERFDQARFARKQEEDANGVRISVSSPEDTILAKLRWARLTGNGDKHIKDAMHVYELQRPSLDVTYLESWVKQLGVADLWARLQVEARPL